MPALEADEFGASRVFGPAVLPLQALDVPLGRALLWVADFAGAITDQA